MIMFEKKKIINL